MLQHTALSTKLATKIHLVLLEIFLSFFSRPIDVKKRLIFQTFSRLKSPLTCKPMTKLDVYCPFFLLPFYMYKFRIIVSKRRGKNWGSHTTQLFGICSRTPNLSEVHCLTEIIALSRVMLKTFHWPVECTWRRTVISVPFSVSGTVSISVSVPVTIPISGSLSLTFPILLSSCIVIPLFAGVQKTRPWGCRTCRVWKGD